MKKHAIQSYLIIIFFLLVQSGCNQDQFGENDKDTLISIGELSQPGSFDTVTSFDVFLGIDKKIHLAVDTGKTRYYLWSEDKGETWSQPNLVSIELSRSKQANDIQFAATQDKLLIIWKGSGELPGYGAAQLAVSSDRGKSWQQIESPAKGDLTQNQGYFSLISDEKSFHFFWLDDREEVGNSQGLRYAHSADGIEWSHDETVATGLCTCCWISTVLNSKKLHVLYRNEQPRDMKLVTRDLDNNNWLPSSWVGSFDWEFIGCPHQGGALAQTVNGELHSIVWTGKEEVAGLHYLLSSDLGVSWLSHAPLSGGEGSNVSLAGHNESILAAWNDRSGGKSVIQLILKNGNKPLTKSTLPSTGSVFPRVVAVDQNFRIFWTERDETGKKRLKSILVKQIVQKVK